MLTCGLDTQLSKTQIRRLIDRLNNLFAGYLPPVRVRFTTRTWHEAVAVAVYRPFCHEIVLNPSCQDEWTPDTVAHEFTHAFVPLYRKAWRRNRTLHGAEFKAVFESVRGLVEEIVAGTSTDFLEPLVQDIAREVDGVHLGLVKRRSEGEIAWLGYSRWRRRNWDEWDAKLKEAHGA